MEFSKRLGADVAVVSQLLDLQDPAIGSEADLAQGGQIFEAAAHPETRLADVLCPTMLIHGHESRWLTDRDVEAASDAVRRLRVEEVPGGHVVLWDAMAETSALVRDFLVAKDRTA